MSIAVCPVRSGYTLVPAQECSCAVQRMLTIVVLYRHVCVRKGGHHLAELVVAGSCREMQRGGARRCEQSRVAAGRQQDLSGVLVPSAAARKV